MRSAEQTKVLYIAGFGRSGSTILGNVLNEVNDFFNVGELQLVWHHGLACNYLCGCERPFRNCSTWKSIFDHAFGGMDAIDGEAMADLRWNHAPHNRDVAVAELKGNRLRVPKKLTTVVEKLYRSIEEVSGSQVIVDSSKFPSYAYILDRIPSIDLHCVHLVRDVRACTYSWTKEKTRRDVRRGARRTMRQFGSLRTSAKWSFQNVLVEQICRERPDHYTRVRYEDFCRDAPAEIRRVLCSVGEGERSLPMASDQSVELRGSHTVWGNPSRTRTGSIKIRLDDTWKTELGAITTAGVTALTWPLLLRYGYPLWT